MQQDKIALLRKIDRTTTKIKIMELVTRCTQLLNVQNNMNAIQIEFCAENILEKMWMYSLEDVQLCLDRGAIGEYGTIYNRIDPATILAWFPKYDAQRQIAVEAINQKAKENNNIYELFDHPQMNAVMNEVVTNLHSKMLQEPVPYARPKLSPFEQILIDEYDALPMWDNDMRFRVYQNKPYQFTEYRKARVQEIIEEQNEY
jgi:hypothetical protein